MGIRAIGIYEFDVIGDAVSTEALVPLRSLKNPTLIKDEYIPTEIFKASSIGGITVTATLEDSEFIRLKFSAPPSATNPIKVSVTAKFGTDRI